MTKSIMKFLMWITISIGLLVGSVYATFSYIDHWESKNVKTSTKAEKGPTEVQIKDEVDLKSEMITDAEVQTILHGMTHQKVAANEKWTFTRMSSKNIKATIAIVEKNKDHLSQYDFYMKALREWEKGDFSHCVEVHNQVWKWQGGNVGIATRLATAEEEKAYLESTN
jgi:hypothetical protein